MRPIRNIVYLTPAFTIGEEDLERLTGAVISVLKRWTRPSRVRAARAEKPAAPVDQRETFAKEADDLDAVRKSAEDAAVIRAGYWLRYLFVLYPVHVRNRKSLEDVARAHCEAIRWPESRPVGPDCGPSIKRAPCNSACGETP